MQGVTGILGWIIRFFHLFFQPKKFIQIATQRSIEEEFKTNIKLASKFPTKKLPAEREEEFRKNEEERVKIIRETIGRSLFMGLSTLLCALITNYTFDQEQFSPKILAVISTFLLLWAVFGYAGWEIQSTKGTTLPEQANKYWFRALQAIGMYTLFLAILSSS